MLSKRINPMMIGRLSELLVSGNRAAGFLDTAVSPSPSPRSPLEHIIQSPRGLKNYDVIGGVGLGIVAALEKTTGVDSSSSSGHETLAKLAASSSDTNMNRSDPIPVKIGAGPGMHRERLETESLEDYTYVTSHGPDNKLLTKVYYDHHGKNRHGTIVFDASSIAGVEQSQAAARFVDETASYPTSDFLSTCQLCNKKLHGKDIYMYRGEKGFCSAECRSRQIMIDERKEQCRSEVQRSADVSSSPYTPSPIFSTGILAI